MATQSVAAAAALPSAASTGLLNAVLRNQFTSTNQVFLNSFILEHWGYHLCAERMYVESVKETRRSMRSLRHLTLMGVEPALAGTPGLYSPARPLVGRDLGELFEIEKHHAEQSLAIIRSAVSAQPATDALDFLAHAQKGQAEYIAWLALQLEALGSAGEARYRDGQGDALQDGDLKSFLAKVKELQAHDPDLPGAPAVPDKFHHDAAHRVLGWFDALLAIEILSIERDFADAFIFDHRGEAALADRIVIDALGAMRRAQRITEQILELGRAPAPAAPADAAAALSARGSVRDYLDAERLLEERKAAVARAALASPDLAPGVTQTLLGGLLRLYERRATWLESFVAGGGAAREVSPVPPGTFRAMLQRWGVPA